MHDVYIYFLRDGDLSGRTGSCPAVFLCIFIFAVPSHAALDAAPRLHSSTCFPNHGRGRVSRQTFRTFAMSRFMQIVSLTYVGNGFDRSAKPSVFRRVPLYIYFPGLIDAARRPTGTPAGDSGQQICYASSHTNPCVYATNRRSCSVVGTHCMASIFNGYIGLYEPIPFIGNLPVPKPSLR